MNDPNEPSNPDRHERGQDAPLGFFAHAAWLSMTQLPDPLALFGRLTRNGRRPHTVLLESAEPSSRRTQRSILTVSSALSIVCFGRRITLTAFNSRGQALLSALEPRFDDFLPRRAADGALELTVPNDAADADDPSCADRARLRAPSSLTVLRRTAALLNECLPHSPEAVFLTGVFAYDLADQFEPLPPAAPGNDFPDYQFEVADRLIVIDPIDASTQVMALALGDSPANARRQAEKSAAKMRRIAERAGASPASGAENARTDASPAAEAMASDIDDAAFAGRVEALKTYIRAGDVFQIVFSRAFSTPCQDPLMAYRALRAINPSPYLFYYRGENWTLFGASPESAVKVDGLTRRVEISPIAGTRRRGHLPDGRLDLDWDSRLEAELRLDEKENAEHMMLVDLARNDVARVSVPGSRHVSELLRTERYSHVMHLASRVCGTLDEGLDALHAYQAGMNMGTLTGAPKIRAMQLLRQYEGKRRGHYGGAIGYLRGDGSLDTAIVIRAALVQEGMAAIRAGAGIVFDSVPRLEADETRRKAEAVWRAIRQAEAVFPKTPRETVGNREES